MFDGKAFGEEMVEVVKAYVDRATAPLLARIADLEQRQPEKGDPGKDADPALIDRLVAAAVANLPPPLKGDPGRDADPAVIQRAVADAVAQIPIPKDGKDADPYAPDHAAIRADLEEIVNAHMAAIPAPQDGKSVTVADVTPMIEDLIARAVAAIPRAKDGIGAAGALIDRDGALILTLTNGETRNLGSVVGKDADQAAIERIIHEAVAQIPAPKDGRDALGFDDLEFEHDGERGITLRFVRGEQTKTFAFRVPSTIYRGVWREAAYEKGDAVTWAGSLWVAQKDTDAKPDSGDGWQLAVKRGRDGKDTVAR